MRKPLIAGNWKMHFTPTEAVDFTEKLLKETYAEGVEKALCVPATHLTELAKLVKGSGFGLGAENMHYEEKGAFTGEISPVMLNDIGVDYVILGHSERRELFHEDDAFIAKKVLSALAHDIDPILCCGETLEERERGEAESKVKGQILKDLEEVPAERMAQIVMAYEPIWAIGTGKTASSADAEDMCAFIRKVLAEKYGEAIAEQVRILYGGSVKPGNVSELMSQPNIDGALVGGASLDVESFKALVNY